MPKQEEENIKTAWEKVQLARKSDRWKTMDYIEKITDEFIEFHGDRLFSDDASIIGGIGRIGEEVVTIIGQQKGKTTKENMERNFGMTNPEGYRKALRLMKQAEKFKRPIITFIDTPGAYPGIGAEERGQGEAIARNMFEMASLKVPVMAIVIGEGSSGGALALCVADKIMMLENAVYSILSPEGFASILYKDASRSEEAAEKMKITAEDLQQLGIIDSIIPEDGNEAETMKKEILSSIKELKNKTTETMLQQRYNKYRGCGTVNGDPVPTGQKCPVGGQVPEGEK